MENVVEKKLQGKHVLFMLLGFFGYMLLANGTFVYFALTTFSGLSEENPYIKGVSYNKAIEAERLQRARGWVTELTAKSVGAKAVEIGVSLSDKNGKVIKARSASGRLLRPAMAGEDISFDLVSSETGFEAVVVAPDPGQWTLSINVEGGGYDVPFRIEKRIWIKQ